MSRLVRVGIGSLSTLTLALTLGCGGPEAELELDAEATTAGSDARSDDRLLNEATKPTLKLIKAKVLPSCAGVIGCHRRPPFGAGLDLTNDNVYASLVNVQSRIVADRLRVKPGDSANSFFYQKLTNDLAAMGEGVPMPKSEGSGWKQLSSSNLSLVKKWIDAGALNN
jgi:hypothetical protein